MPTFAKQPQPPTGQKGKTSRAPRKSVGGRCQTCGGSTGPTTPGFGAAERRCRCKLTPRSVARKRPNASLQSPIRVAPVATPGKLLKTPPAVQIATPPAKRARVSRKRISPTVACEEVSGDDGAATTGIESAVDRVGPAVTDVVDEGQGGEPDLSIGDEGESAELQNPTEVVVMSRRPPPPNCAPWPSNKVTKEEAKEYRHLVECILPAPVAAALLKIPRALLKGRAHSKRLTKKELSARESQDSSTQETTAHCESQADSPTLLSVNAMANFESDGRPSDLYPAQPVPNEVQMRTDGAAPDMQLIPTPVAPNLNQLSAVTEEKQLCDNEPTSTASAPPHAQTPSTTPAPMPQQPRALAATPRQKVRRSKASTPRRRTTSASKRPGTKAPIRASGF